MRGIKAVIGRALPCRPGKFPGSEKGKYWQKAAGENSMLSDSDTQWILGSPR